jgi:hypothetical protein
MDISDQLNQSPPIAGQSRKFRFSLRSLLIFSVVISWLLAGLAFLIREARQDARLTQCRNNLRVIALAFHNYHDVHKEFPPAIIYASDGTPMHSWRVLIAPFLMQNAFYDCYDFADVWNGPTNQWLTDEVPDDFGLPGKYGTMVFDAAYLCYRCPGARRSQNRMFTNYVMLIDNRPGQPNGPPHRPGSASPAQPGDLHVIVLEIADSDIHWMEPRDVLLNELSFRINDPTARSPSSFHGGVCALRVDGSIEVFDETTAAEYVKRVLTQQ